MTEQNQKQSVQNAPSRSGGKVTVMLKHPAGIIMRLFNMEDYDEPVFGGGTKVKKRAVQNGEAVRLNGTALQFGQVPDYLILGGYACTPEVDEDFFNEWMRQNASLDLVKNKLIFATSSENAARGYAKEHAGIKSGLEPLAVSMDPNVPSSDPRIPRNIRAADKKVA